MQISASVYRILVHDLSNSHSSNIANLEACSGDVRSLLLIISQGCAAVSNPGSSAVEAAQLITPVFALDGYTSKMNVSVTWFLNVESTVPPGYLSTPL